jgi:hypothetical protein
VILALVIFACVDPELAEVYLGDTQLLLATLALAAIALAMLASVRPDVSRQLGAFVPGDDSPGSAQQSHTTADYADNSSIAPILRPKPPFNPSIRVISGRSF